MQKILERVLKKITPSEKEQKEFNSVVTEIRNLTDEIIKPLGLSHIIAGSFSRNTWLPYKKEFDLFIMFPETTSRQELEKKGLQIGKKIVSKLNGKYEIAYAEHPYIRSEVKGFQLDIVPCYKVKSAEQIKSAVDRTPFHNKYLDNNLGVLAPDVRLMKKFCKSIGVYGSDLKTEGFSGYLCEILIINYGSFEKLVKEASRWEPGKIFIDLERNGYRKFENPLVVIDPVDRKRNVASALSPYNFIKFVEACKAFVKKPEESMFFPKPKKISKIKIEKELKSRGTKFFIIEFEKPNVVDDIIYPQLRKAAKRLADILKDNEFMVLGYDIHADKKCYIFLEMEVWKLPNKRKLTGPSIFDVKHAKQFLEKYKKDRIFIEDKYWTAEVDRKFILAEMKIKDSLSNKLKDLKSKGIPSYIAKSVSKGFKIHKTLKTLPKGSEEFIYNYLNKRLL